MGAKVCSELTGRDSGAVEAPRIHHVAPVMNPLPRQPPGMSSFNTHMSHSGHVLGPSLPAGTIIRPPPSHWSMPVTTQRLGNPSAPQVILKQADGFPEVYVYAQPSQTSWVGSIPSNTCVNFLGSHGLFRQIKHGDFCGWVGAKHVGHIHPTHPTTSSASNPLDPSPASPLSPLSPLSPEVSPKSWEISSPPSPGVTGVTCGLFSPWSVTHDEKTTTTTTELPQFQSPEAGCLPLVAGSHEWIRKANSETWYQKKPQKRHGWKLVFFSSWKCCFQIV